MEKIKLLLAQLKKLRYYNEEVLKHTIGDQNMSEQKGANYEYEKQASRDTRSKEDSERTKHGRSGGGKSSRRRFYPPTKSDTQQSCRLTLIHSE